MPPIRLLLPACALLALGAAPSAARAGGGAGVGSRRPTTVRQPTASPTRAPGPTGGAGIGASPAPPSTPARPTVAGDVAHIVNGVAYAPSFAPAAVKRAIWAGDAIRSKPYIIGGGHGRWNSPGYDCSGSVSYVLHAAGLLKASEDSGELASWAHSGTGRWITVYTNPAHAFIEIAGIRLDTSAEDDPDPAPGTGPRWRPLMDATPGFMARHPALY